MPMTPKELLAHVPQRGALTWIGTRIARGEPMRVCTEVTLRAGYGIRGDRAAKRKGGKRQVSLIQDEHFAVMTQLLGRDVSPEIVRRNFVLRGINVRALMRNPFWVGEALLEGSGECAPCRKMETALGHGGYAVMRGHGGIIAKILHGGVVRLGDSVRIATAEEWAEAKSRASASQ